MGNEYMVRLVAVEMTCSSMAWPEAVAMRMANREEGVAAIGRDRPQLGLMPGVSCRSTR